MSVIEVKTRENRGYSVRGPIKITLL
jgi:hypothetical protein